MEWRYCAGEVHGRVWKVVEAREIAISMSEGRENERRGEKVLSFVTCDLERARGEIWEIEGG